MNSEKNIGDGNFGPGDDPAFESLLAEVVGGTQPPDLSSRILAALRDGATEDQPPIAIPPRIALENQAAVNETNAFQIRSSAAANTQQAELRRKHRPWPLLIGLASLAASVAVALIYFPETRPNIHTSDVIADKGAVQGVDLQGVMPEKTRADGQAASEDSIATNQQTSAGSNTERPAAKPIRLDGPDFAAASPTSPMLDSTTEQLPLYPKVDQRLNDAEIVDLIDARLAAAWKSEGVEPTVDVTSEVFVRRLTEVLGEDVDFAGQDLLASLRGGLKQPGVRKRLASRLAASLLGRTGVRRINKDQFIEFVKFLEPTLGSRRFDAVASEMLMARGAVEPGANGFEPAAVWMGALVGPQSVSLTEQAGHALLDVDLRCGRCHDHPLDGRVWQEDYWQFSAMFDTGLRWLVGKDGVLEVQSPEVSADPNVVFYERTDGRQRAATPKAPMSWIAGTAVTESKTLNPSSGAAELARFAATMRNNPQLAKAAVNRVWESVYGRPLVGSAADPSAAPEAEAIVELHGELAEQFRAHDFDMAKLFTWVLASRPMRLGLPAAWQSPMYESASGAQLAAAAEQVRAFASFPVATPKRRFNDLLARVNVRDRGLAESLDAASNFPGGLLGQFQSSNESDYNSNKNYYASSKSVSTSVDQLLAASLEATEFVGEGLTSASADERLPAEWLGKVEGPDPFQRRAEHLYYLAGYWHPSPQQLEVARALRDQADSDASALRRLWWVLANESL